MGHFQAKAVKNECVFSTFPPTHCSSQEAVFEDVGVTRGRKLGTSEHWLQAGTLVAADPGSASRKAQAPGSAGLTCRST